ncbi:hypothetical protein BAE44_0024383 [Dichanthelium oligosanthes]|uniref:RING-type E3 ubiquitin transferase n=1 Tax=Dichanthelium oligosanthes TaxID=888268 RepID=A0A1E5UP55_9POAL|nr:hypothetical protein BAE44_0024383 [Dichanthelium oligosanthes]
MSSPAAGSAPPVVYEGGDSPFVRRQQQDYSFSGRVLLTAVVVLAILTVVFVLIRLLMYQIVARGRGGSLRTGVLRRSVLGSFGRSGRHGLDAAALAALPVTAYCRKASNDDGSTSTSTSAAAASGATECAVCLSELADGEKVRALPSCGHVFHVECVDAWLRSRTTCPVCRADVRPPKQQGTQGARRPSAPAPHPPPALFGAGGTLVVTVEGGGAETRDARTSALGSVNRPGP